MKARSTDLKVIEAAGAAAAEAAFAAWRAESGEAEILRTEVSGSGGSIVIAIWFTGGARAG
jgi:hypothetical protein